MRELRIRIGDQLAFEIGETKCERLAGVLQRCVVERIVDTIEGDGSDWGFAVSREGLNGAGVRGRFQLQGAIGLRMEDRETWTCRCQVADQKCAVMPCAVEMSGISVDAFNDGNDVGTGLMDFQLPGMFAFGAVFDGNVSRFR